eukprot:1155470-Pelagomonas_calceolata.AAC.9
MTAQAEVPFKSPEQTDCLQSRQSLYTAVKMRLRDGSNGCSTQLYGWQSPPGALSKQVTEQTAIRCDQRLLATTAQAEVHIGALNRQIARRASGCKMKNNQRLLVALNRQLSSRGT